MATRTIPSQVYAPNQYVFPLPSDVAGRFQRIDLTFTRESWPDVPNLLTVSLEKSTDGGASWEPMSGGCSFMGGDIVKPNGDIVATQTCNINKGDTPIVGSLRLVFVVGTTLRTAITAVVT